MLQKWLSLQHCLNVCLFITVTGYCKYTALTLYRVKRKRLVVILSTNITCFFWKWKASSITWCAWKMCLRFLKGKLEWGPSSKYALRQRSRRSSPQLFRSPIKLIYLSGCHNKIIRVSSSDRKDNCACLFMRIHTLKDWILDPCNRYCI